MLNILDENIKEFEYEKISDGYKFKNIDRELLLEIRNEFLKVEVKRESEEVVKQQIKMDFKEE